MSEISNIKDWMEGHKHTKENKTKSTNIFNEIKNKNYEGKTEP